VNTGEIIVQLKGKKTFNVILLRENIKLGQRVDDWAVDAWIDGKWKEYAKGSAIGSSRMIRGDYISTDKIRVRILKSAASICLSDLHIYTAPLPMPAK
jgi:alpha-L-fucosidase